MGILRKILRQEPGGFVSIPRILTQSEELYPGFLIFTLQPLWIPQGIEEPIATSASSLVAQTG